MSDQRLTRGVCHVAPNNAFAVEMFTSIELETFAASDTGMFGSRKETVKKALVCERRLHADDASPARPGKRRLHLGSGRCGGASPNGGSGSRD
jgi:hypothetical protein